MKRWLALAALAVQLALATTSGAQPATDVERAKASFKAGANAYAAGDYLAAIQALETAYQLSPLPAIAFSLAQAERKQYLVARERVHLERALELFRRYLEQDPRGARREDALSALALLEPLLGAKPASVEAAAKVQARPTRLMIVSDTPGAQISLDDAPAAASPLIREVTPGKHRARVRARGYLEVRRDVIAVAGELLMTEVQLSELPSSLHVWAPADAQIYVDGVYVGRGGARLTVPLRSGTYQLSVAQKGRRLVRRNLEIERGKARSEVVELEPTVQRSLSELLFIGGGAALGAGVALSAFAIRSENRAEAFIARQQRRTVEEAELVAYHASLVERDRYRTAAAVSVAGSFGLFITGLFLHELDRPSILAAPQREPSLPSSDSRGAEGWSLAPVARAADVGASLQVNF